MTTPERITTAEAARRLGVSQAGVRRRVKAGQLTGEWEDRPQGKRLVILWDGAEAIAEGAPAGEQIGVPDANAYAKLQADNEWLRERLERAEEAQAELRRMLFAEQRTVATLRQLLPAPRDATRTTDANWTPTDTPTGEAPPPDEGDERLGLHRMAHELEKRRPWWLRDWRKRGKGS